LQKGFFRPDYLDFIYGESLRADEFMEAMTAIARELGKVQFIISRVAERSRLNELIKASLMPEQYRTGSDPCVHIDLALKSVEYYEKLSKNTRQNLRTSLNRLEKDKLHFEIRSRTHEPVPLTLLWRMTVIYWRRMAEKGITLGLTK